MLNTLSSKRFVGISQYLLGAGVWLASGVLLTPAWAEALHYDSARIQQDAAQAKACFRFDYSLDTSQDFEPLFELTPKPTKHVNYSVDYSEVCLSGLSYDQQYAVVIHPGVKSKQRSNREQYELADRIEETIDTGRRVPSISFSGNKFILPIDAEPKVPMTTINVPKVRLELLKINPRNLLSVSEHGIFQKASTYSGNLDYYTEQYGDHVWSGTVTVPTEANKSLDVALPIKPLAELGEGLYVLAAADERDVIEADGKSSYDVKLQWLVRTDIGVTTYLGEAGMAASIRSLASAEAITDAKLTLLSQNNTVLAEQMSDDNGMAIFGPELVAGKGGLRPELLIAEQAGDLTFLKLQSKAIDLSDRGVSGRSPLDKLNAFAYTDRGIYRRGDAVNIVALLRDQQAAAVTNQSLRMTITQPDQQVVVDTQLGDDVQGGYGYQYLLSDSAAGGSWSVAFFANAQTKEPIGRVSFTVADIVPPRLRVDFEEVPQRIRFDENTTLTATAEYLFGAAAGNLETSGKLYLRLAQKPFAKFPNFSFGRRGRVQQRTFAVDATETNEQGQFSIAILAEDIEGELGGLDAPLAGEVITSVIDTDGRGVSAKATFSVTTENEWVGLRALATEKENWWGDEQRVTFPLNQTIDYEVQTVDALGEPIQLRDMTYRLVEEDYYSQWYYDNDAWHWKQEFFDVDSETGEVVFDGSGRANLKLAGKGWGYYRLEILDETETLMTSQKLRVGWARNEGLAGTPDVVEIATDKEKYLPDEKITLNIESPLEGYAQVLLAGNDISQMQVLYDGEIAAEKSLEVSLDAKADWGGGAYILVNAYRPDGKKAEMTPDRAVGVHWLSLDVAARELGVSFAAPKRIHGQETLSVTINLDNLAQTDGKAYLTLAAVDEGVLQLSNFKTPEPIGFFFDQRLLPYSLRDNYGFILDAFAGQAGVLETGGDGGVLQKKSNQLRPDTDIKIVSLYSGLVDVVDGKADVVFTVPDFAGELRLMAVAWNAEQFGAGEQPVKVSDPMVILASKPRFMAVGDRSTITVQLFNQELADQDYTVELDYEGLGLFFSEAISRPVKLAKGENHTFTLPIEAMEMGSHHFTLTVTGEDGFVQHKPLMMGVRPPYTPMDSRDLVALETSESTLVFNDLTEIYDPASISGEYRIVPSPTFGLVNQLKQLDRYPYGCLEQTTSKALPMLYFDALAARLGYEPKHEPKRMVERGIDRVFNKQMANGSFSLWGYRGDTAEWASVYAIDFLVRARDLGYRVSSSRLSRALVWLNGFVNSSDTQQRNVRAKMYGHYVLARAGYGGLEKAMQRYRRYQYQLKGTVESAMLGATFAELGDREAAIEAFAYSYEHPNEKTEGGYHYWGYNYGSPLRDAAMRYVLMMEQKLDNIPQHGISRQVERINDLVGESRRWLSTQERAWLALAASASEGGSEIGDMIEIDIGGDKTPIVIGQGYPIDETIAQSGLSLVNTTDKPLWVETDVSGVTWEPPSEQSHEVRVSKTLLSTSMKPVKLDALKQGELYLVHITGTVTVPRSVGSRQMLLVDFLPSGFEIENADIENSAAAVASEWYEANDTAEYVDEMDDRYIAAFDVSYRWHHDEENKLPRYASEFSRLYVVRAVSPGEYVWPNTVVEDMISPSVRGNSSVQSIVIQ